MGCVQLVHDVRVSILYGMDMYGPGTKQVETCQPQVDLAMSFNESQITYP